MEITRLRRARGNFKASTPHKLADATQGLNSSASSNCAHAHEESYKEYVMPEAEKGEARAERMPSHPLVPPVIELPTFASQTDRELQAC